MKRHYKLLLGILLTFLSFFVIIFSVSYYQTRQKSANIFDEVYYNETSPVSRLFLFGNTYLGTLDDIKTKRKEHSIQWQPTYQGPDYVEESYKTTSGTSLNALDIYCFYQSKSDELYIFISRDLAGGDTLDISYTYDISSRRITRKIMQNFRGAHSDHYSEDKSTILQTLKENHLSLQDAYDYGNKILKTKVLKDWTSVYPSRFSPNDWGDVKLVDKWSDE